MHFRVNTRYQQIPEDSSRYQQIPEDTSRYQIHIANRDWVNRSKTVHALCIAAAPLSPSPNSQAPATNQAPSGTTYLEMERSRTGTRSLAKFRRSSCVGHICLLAEKEATRASEKKMSKFRMTPKNSNQ